MLFDFLSGVSRCSHEKVNPGYDMEYCPDCGELIENQWFITRCACCGIKHTSLIKNNKIVSAEKFCHNCGSSEFRIEKLPKINFIDVNFAVVMKKVFCAKDSSIYVQSWVDAKKENDIQRLLTLSR